MIICCLCPFIGRYFQSTPFGVQSWYYYKNVYDFADRLDHVAFCGYEKNFPTPEDLKNQKYKVFLAEEDLKKWRYKILDQKVYENTDKTFVPSEIMDRLVKESGGSVLQAWRKIMTEPYPPLVKFYRNFLKKCADKEPLEFIRATANDVSMSVAAAEFNVPFVHYEKGPLRLPDYLDTAYWDLSGVNGGTECGARWKSCSGTDWQDMELSREELLFLFCSDNSRFEARCTVVKQDADAGVAGQVDDDSNVLAYANGFSNFETLQFARHLFPDGHVLVRRHPAAQTLCVGQNDIDPRVYHFIQRVGLVVCINSSVALEAALMGKNSLILGDSPFLCLSSSLQGKKIIPPDNLTAKLNFILLNYLVPVPMVDTLEYTQWRLSKPSELEIRKRHLSEFLRIRGFSGLQQFREAFRQYHPERREETPSDCLYLEPASIIQRAQDYAGLKYRNGILEIRNAELEKQYGELSAKYAGLEQEQAGLLGQRDQQKNENDVLTARNTELENDLAGLKYRNGILEIRNAELEKQYGELSAKYAGLEQEQAGLLGQRDQQKNENDVLTARNTELENDLAGLNTHHSELEKQYEYLSARQAGLMVENSQQKSENEALASQNTELENKLADLNTRHRDLEKQYDELSGKHAELEREYADLTAENNQRKSENEALTAQNTKLEKDLADLNTRHSELEKQYEELSGKHAGLEQEHADLIDLNTRQTENIHQLQQSLASSQKENAWRRQNQYHAWTDLQQSMDNELHSQQQIEKLQEQNRQLERQNGNVKNQNWQLEQRNQQLQQQNAAAEEQNRQLEQKNQELESRNQQNTIEWERSRMALNAHANVLSTALKTLYHSKSFRIGRGLTAPVRGISKWMAAVADNFRRLGKIKDDCGSGFLIRQFVKKITLQKQIRYYSVVSSIGVNCEVSFHISRVFHFVDSYPLVWAFVHSVGNLPQVIANPSVLLQPQKIKHDFSCNMCNYTNQDISFHCRKHAGELLNPDGSINEQVAESEREDLRSRLTYLCEKWHKLLQDPERSLLCVLTIFEYTTLDEVLAVNQALKKYPSVDLLVVLTGKENHVKARDLKKHGIMVRFISYHPPHNAITDPAQNDIRGWNRILYEFRPSVIRESHKKYKFEK